MFVLLSFFFTLLIVTYVSLPRVKPYNILTVHFNFTEANFNVRTIIIRIRPVSSVDEVDDVSPVVRTGDVDRIRYRGYGVIGVPKTQHSVIFVCCVGNVDRESQKEPTVPVFISKTMIKGTRNIYNKQTKEII